MHENKTIQMLFDPKKNDSTNCKIIAGKNTHKRTQGANSVASQFVVKAKIVKDIVITAVIIAACATIFGSIAKVMPVHMYDILTVNIIIKM